MRKQINKKRTIAVLVAIICVCVSAGLGYELNYLREIENSRREYPPFVNLSYSSTKYEINPETILSSLDQGKTEVFNHIIAAPEDYTPLAAGSFVWTQSDYFKIASALGRIEMNEDLNGWHVLGMWFDKECSDDLKGFDSGSINYFKTDTDNGTMDYLHYQTITIAIDPLFKIVDVGRGNFPRPLLGWRSINSFNITADDALKIAEEKGGEEVRLKTNNKCKIGIYFSPVDGNKYFEVNYWGWFIIHSIVVF